ncbi:histone-lysine N-methyltransferase SETMAR [Trichonephila clavipes]|nr:histone-lysine N-methyltransferase SETMAR [Trichonephila clavipes]
MMDRISICEDLAKRNEIDPFLKRMVTGDEKWIPYYNIVRKRSCSKCGEAAQKELLPHGQTLNSDLCCQQLDRLKLEIDQKWPKLANRRGVVLHQDNARPHTSVVTRQNLWELSLEVLVHPPYSPDLAPSVCHLFLALQNFLSDKKLGSGEDCENQLLDVFANKCQYFYAREKLDNIAYIMVLDESRSFFRVHTGYFSNIPKCIKAEFIASWACSQSSVVSSSQR